MNEDPRDQARRSEPALPETQIDMEPVAPETLVQPPEGSGACPPPPGETLPLVDCAIARKRFSSVGLSCVVLLAAATAAQLLLMIPMLVGGSLGQSSWYVAVATFLPMIVVGYPVCMAVLRCAPKGQLEKQKMSLRGFLVCLLMSIGLMYAGNYIGLAVTALMRVVFRTGGTNPLETVVGATDVLTRLIFMVIAAPLCEEYIFRKQMIDRLHRYGEGVSILVSALLFALIHGNLSQFFYAFLLGALFGYIYTRTGTIWYTIGLHAAVNFLGGILAPLVAEAVQVSGLSVSPGQLAAAAAAALYSLALMAAMVAGIVLLIRRRKHFVLRPTEAELPRGQRARTALCNPGMLLTLILLGLLTILSSILTLRL